MGRTFTPPIKSARKIILEKGKSYIYKGKYITVYVFTTWVSEVVALVHAFEGHYYRHGTGYRWVLSKKGNLINLVKNLTADFPSTNQFEKPIIEHYFDYIWQCPQCGMYLPTSISECPNHKTK